MCLHAFAVLCRVCHDYDMRIQSADISCLSDEPYNGLLSALAEVSP